MLICWISDCRFKAFYIPTDNNIYYSIIDRWISVCNAVYWRFAFLHVVSFFFLQHNAHDLVVKFWHKTHSVRVKKMSHYVHTNSPDEYPAVSCKQLLKHSLELWSLAWQPSLLQLNHRPLHIPGWKSGLKHVMWSRQDTYGRNVSKVHSPWHIKMWTYPKR